MENPFTDCKQSIEMYHEEMFTTRQHNPDSLPKFHIQFSFSCKPVYHKGVLHQDYPTSPRWVEVVTQPKIDSFASVSLGDFISQEPARKTIKKSLKRWPVNENWLRNFINYTMIKARDEIIKMPGCHNSIHLKFKVSATDTKVFDVSAAKEARVKLKQVFGDADLPGYYHLEEWMMNAVYEDEWMEKEKEDKNDDCDSKIDQELNVEEDGYHDSSSMVPRNRMGSDITCWICLEGYSSQEMENSNSGDLCGVEANGDGRIDNPASTSASYKLFSRQSTVHQMMGGGKGIIDE
ncbi:hypothetical protein BUALT_Bualt01G0055500 [Buddleja alternifolia]|uniref:Uncharacterized protein n=1 Tax=Buddleja alternifolia TaxID=168488 RepID=A0AAV6YBN1_9LAMI|nr:hypothetical protein BUALT_Bualt01G0055500 [Buddleja alternifolia]